MSPLSSATYFPQAFKSTISLHSPISVLCFLGPIPSHQEGILGQPHRPGWASTYLESRMMQFCALRPSMTDSSLTLREAR